VFILWQCFSTAHQNSAKHNASLSAVVSSSPVASFSKSGDPQYEELIIAVKKATFAYHTAVHD
jgi:hypothetical protein